MKKKFVSLFSGAGGLDQGFIDAGWEPALMTDFWKPAVDTLVANHPGVLIPEWDLSTVSDKMLLDALALQGIDPKDVSCVTGGPPCLPAEEEVLTASGPKPICAIRKGDLVLTTSGRYRPVLSTGSKWFSGLLYGIRPQGYCEPVWFTGNHPIYVDRDARRGFIPADMVIPRDKIGFPIVQAEIGSEADVAGLSLIGHVENPHLWFLAGAYVGDGYLRGGPSKAGKKRYEISWCPGPRSGAAAMRICESLKGIGQHYMIVGDENNIKIKANNKALWLFLNQFGRGSGNKCPPERLLSTSDAVLHAFMEGLLATDGCILPPRQIDLGGRIQKISEEKQITSISLSLLKWVQRAMLRFGHLGGIRQIYDAGTSMIEGRSVTVRPCFTIRWIHKPAKRYYKIADGMLWVPVKEIYTKQTDTRVYNLEVAEDHTFCAHLIGTHNCQPFSRLNQNQLFEGDSGREKDVNMNDPRRSLFMDFLRIVRCLRPPFFVMENVADLRTRKLGGDGAEKNELIKDIILREFERAGYRVAAGVLWANEHGVPQLRRRIIFMGVRGDLGIEPSMPPKIGTAGTSVRSEFARIRAGHPNQERKNHSPEWLKRARLIPPGGYYADLPLEHKVLKPVDVDFISAYDGQVRHFCIKHAITGCNYPKHMRGKWEQFHTNKGSDKIAQVGDGDGVMTMMALREHATMGCELFRVMPRMGTYLRRIRWDVSHTVTRNPLIHPSEDREITVREKAAIQTFPPNYEFRGKRQEQHILVGNAVPCNLGREIAYHIDRMVG